METPFGPEVQNTVAKLLAKENISIHRSFKYKTAFFDIKNRILGLPVWNDAPREVYDLFISHEVGHALYTFEEDFRAFLAKFNGKKSLYNILEDIRIEKKIQQTYPGSVRLFQAGYVYLFENEFFGTNDIAEINAKCFLDRLNITAKTGQSVVWSDEEAPLAAEALAIETVDELFAVAEKIIDFIRSQNQTQAPENDPELPDFSDPDDDSPSEPADEAEANEFEETEAEAESSDDKPSPSESDKPKEKPAELSHDDADGEPNLDADEDLFESETMDELEQNMKDNVVENGSAVDLIWRDRDIIHDYKEVLEVRKQPRHEFMANSTIYSDQMFKEMMLKNRKTVTHLANEFEQRKAAYEYSRGSVSPRGTLDVNQLHKYKYDDNIFNSIVTKANAKSHGMVFMIDFSISMTGTLLQDVVERTIVLTEFCKRVGIPFEVYSWTSDVNITTYIPDDAGYVQDELYLDSLLMVNQLSSRMSKSEYNTAIKDLYIMAWYGAFSGVPLHRMGGTPLVAALLMGAKKTVEFKAQNNLQVANLMFLSDGSGANFSYATKCKDCPDEVLKRRRANVGESFYAKIGSKKAILSSSYTGNIRNILKALEEQNINSIGYYVTLYTEGWASAYLQLSKQPKDFAKTFREEKIFVDSSRESGFRKYIIINVHGINLDANAKLSERKEPTPRRQMTALNRDFKRVSKAKSKQKVFVKEFIEAITETMN